MNRKRPKSYKLEKFAEALIPEGMVMDRRSAKGLEDILSFAEEHAECEICHGPPDYIGTYCPSPALQRRLLAPPDQELAVSIGLCQACKLLPDLVDRLEASISKLADLVGKHSGLN